MTDPLQMNGYTYANVNPISKSDLSGLKVYDPEGDAARRQKALSNPNPGLNKPRAKAPVVLNADHRLRPRSSSALTWWRSGPSGFRSRRP
jgi:hypothetical protein